MIRKPGERNWIDPLGYQLHVTVPHPMTTPVRDPWVKTNGAGQYTVHYRGYQWELVLGADGEVEILSTDCPRGSYTCRVIQAAQKQ